MNPDLVAVHFELKDTKTLIGFVMLATQIMVNFMLLDHYFKSKEMFVCIISQPVAQTVTYVVHSFTDYLYNLRVVSRI